MDMPKMVRTFHPVGHGAFYTERFYDDNGENTANVIFDCGCFEACKAGISSKVFEQRIKTTIQKEFCKDTKIDALFISHFHTDHINGVDALLGHCRVNRIFIPLLTNEVVLETYLFNFLQSRKTKCAANRFLRLCYENKLNNVIQIKPADEAKTDTKQSITIDEIQEQTISCHPISLIYQKTRSWMYKPYVYPDKKLGSVSQKLFTHPSFLGVISNHIVDFAKLAAAIKKAGVRLCKKIYYDTYKDNHNAYSMTLLSGTCMDKCCLPACLYTITDRNKICSLNCLYMGDYEAEKTTDFTGLYNRYAVNWNYIGLLQVPHHGSEHNINNKLYYPARLCIISAGVTDKYGHPDQQTLVAIQNQRGIPIIVTEDPKTKQVFTYNI